LGPSVKSLIRSVAILALSGEAQEAYLGQVWLGHNLPVDELALVFGDSFLMVPQLQEAGWITDDEAEAARLIDQQLDGMSGATNAHLWTIEALRSSAE